MSFPIPPFTVFNPAPPLSSLASYPANLSAEHCKLPPNVSGQSPATSVVLETGPTLLNVRQNSEIPTKPSIPVALSIL